MYKTETVFVIGAGASYEVKMPLGVHLKEKIKELLDIKFDHSTTPITGDRYIAKALERKIGLGSQEEANEYNRYLAAAWHIRDALAQAISIDNFIENQEDDRISTMAKLAITRSILSAEQKSLLFPKDERGRSDIDWRRITDTWYHGLFQTLVEGRAKSDIGNLFSNVSFVTFNYDRTLEFFLFESIKNYYNVENDIAAELVNGVSITHPYGVVGVLPWQTKPGVRVNFGVPDTINLLDISNSIKTFSEQVDDQTSLINIRSRITESKRIVFLGMAYHDANMEILQPESATSIDRIIGTAFGVSRSDLTVLERRMIRLATSKEEDLRWPGEKISLERDLTCAALFYEFGRTLRA